MKIKRELNEQRKREKGSDKGRKTDVCTEFMRKHINTDTEKP